MTTKQSGNGSNKNGGKTLRVVRPVKFVIFMTLLIVAAITLNLLPTTHAEQLGEQNTTLTDNTQTLEFVEQPVVYRFKAGSIEIVTTDRDEYIAELQTSLRKEVEANRQLQVKYNKLLDKKEKEAKEKKLAEQADKKLYNEYKYAIEFPGSTVTLKDIKMIKTIAKEENIDPHVWLALVKLESGYNSNIRSKYSSAAGWGQVLRGTGRSVYENTLKLGKYNHNTMGTNKEINTRISMRYLSMLNKQYGMHRALINYNGGELGQKYYTIIRNNYKSNTGRTF